jgi:hypothetical protein
LAPDRLRDPEVDHLRDLAPLLAGDRDQQHVLRLEVAMDDAAPMRRRQRGGYLVDDGHGAPDVHRAVARELGREVVPLEELHGEERLPLGRLVEVDHVHDVRVAQRRRDLRLAPKPPPQRRVQRPLPREHLDREAAGQPRVPRLVHLPHPARAHAADDLVRPGQDRAGCQGEPLGGQRSMIRSARLGVNAGRGGARGARPAEHRRGARRVRYMRCA